jgi:surface antigen
MSNDADFDRLMAYCDGELDAAAIAEVEALLARDPAARRTVQSLREVDGLCRAALHAPQREAVPPRLTAAVEAGFAARNRGGGGAGRHATMRWALPLAASIAVAVLGASGAYYGAQYQVDRALARMEAARAEDQKTLAAAVSRALEGVPSGQAVDWRNPDTGTSGTVRPVRTYKSKSDHWCREYEETILRDGTVEHRRGLACREGNGDWRRLQTILLDG